MRYLPYLISIIGTVLLMKLCRKIKSTDIVYIIGYIFGAIIAELFHYL